MTLAVRNWISLLHACCMQSRQFVQHDGGNGSRYETVTLEEQLLAKCKKTSEMRLWNSVGEACCRITGHLFLTGKKIKLFSDGKCSIFLEGRSAENSPVLRNVRCGFVQKKKSSLFYSYEYHCWYETEQFRKGKQLRKHVQITKGFLLVKSVGLFAWYVERLTSM